MSRSTIGGVIGAAIGFVVSGYNPQGAYWGWVIGSGVGALTDNTKTYGPRAGDAAQQTSQDGTVATYGYAEFATTGVILWRAERREIQEEQGKGGPTNVTFKYTWSYAIGVTKKKPIGVYLIIKRNGTIVYDLRSDEELRAVGYNDDQIQETRAAQRKFERVAKFYYGDYDQHADPTIQSIKGIDNTPNYGGIAYIVLTDDDVTDDGAAIPQYEFVVATCGHKKVSSRVLVTGTYKDEGGPMYAVALATDDPQFAGLEQSTGANLYGKPQFFSNSDGNIWAVAGPNGVRYSSDNRNTFQVGAHGWPGSYDLGDFFVGDTGWGVTNMNLSHFDDRQYGGEIENMVDRTYGFVDHEHFTGGFYWRSWAGFLYRKERLDDTYEVHSTGEQAPGVPNIYVWVDIKQIGVSLFATVRDLDGNHRLVVSHDGGITWPDSLIVRAPGELHAPYFICKAGTSVVVYAFGGGVWTSANSWDEWIDTGIAGAIGPPWLPNGGASLYIDGGRRIAWVPTDDEESPEDPGILYVLGYGVDGDKVAVSTNLGMTFPKIAELPITGAVGIAAGFDRRPIRGRAVPDAPGFFVDPRTGQYSGPSNQGYQLCEIMLDSLVIDQCATRRVTRVIANELENDVVRGFRVATQTSPKDNIRSLQGSYFFDGSDHDGYLHFLKRPQPDTFLITYEDLVEREPGKPIEWEFIKENDLLKKVSVAYFDPRTNYTVTSQEWSRAISTIKAQGEGTFDTALTAESSFAKRMAQKSVLVAWAEKDQATFTVRLNHAARYTGEWGKLRDETGRTHVVRITRIENDGIRRHITVRKTRRSAYRSNLIGVSSPLPSFPGSGIRGPAEVAVMNMPVYRDDFDKPGVTWAARGISSGYRGTTLQLKRGATWTTVGHLTDSCNVGELLADLPASETQFDEINELTVFMPYTGLENVSFTELLNERNPLAIQYPDGTVEVLQPQLVTPLGDNVYQCRNLLRGMLDTVRGEHTEGARVVFLDSKLGFAELRKDDIGKTLLFRAVSDGTDPDAAEEFTITMTTMESQREWAPYNVISTRLPGCEWRVDFVGRHRLGSDAAPIASQWFKGWRVDFRIGGTVKSRMTQEESFVYTTDMQTEDWGAVNCGGYITTVSAVNEYAGAGPSGGDQLPNYAPTIIGSPYSGYVGEFMTDALGPDNNPPFQAYGGQTEERFVGEIVANVTCQSANPGSGLMMGVPLTAETRAAATEMIVTGPLTSGGPYLITDSVTIEPKPLFAMMDELKPLGDKTLVTLITTPPRTTKQLTARGLGGLKSRIGFNTGKRRCVFTIAGMPAGGRIAVGVLAAGADAHLAPGTAGSVAHVATADGAFAVETDAATGATTITEIGVGVVATGTLPLTYAYDNQYRFAWSANDAQHPAAGATVHTNQGNEAWPDTPTSGYVGVDNDTAVIPCGFDAAIGSANGYWLQGTTSLTSATQGSINAASFCPAGVEWGKSTGKWRIGMSGFQGARLGFCKAGHTGLIGASGSPDSIGFSDTRSAEGYVIETSFGGVFNRIVIPPFFYYSAALVYFVFDIDAGTLSIYVKVETVAGDPLATYQLLCPPLVGIPAGTWLPAINGAAQLTPEIPAIETSNNWTISR